MSYRSQIWTLERFQPHLKATNLQQLPDSSKENGDGADEEVFLSYKE